MSDPNDKFDFDFLLDGWDELDEDSYRAIADGEQRLWEEHLKQKYKRDDDEDTNS